MKLDDVLNLKPEEFNRAEFLAGLNTEYPQGSGVLKSLVADLVEQYLRNRPALIEHGSTAIFNNGTTPGVSSPHKVAIDLTRQLKQAVAELTKSGAVQATSESEKLSNFLKGWQHTETPAAEALAKAAAKRKKGG